MHVNYVGTIEDAKRCSSWCQWEHAVPGQSPYTSFKVLAASALGMIHSVLCAQESGLVLHGTKLGQLRAHILPRTSSWTTLDPRCKILSQEVWGMTDVVTVQGWGQQAQLSFNYLHYNTVMRKGLCLTICIPSETLTCPMWTAESHRLSVVTYHLRSL